MFGNAESTKSQLPRAFLWHIICDQSPESVSMYFEVPEMKIFLAEGVGGGY